MSRNGSGTYTLPAGNPVVTRTVVSSTWANTTFADIANEITDSLSRSSGGPMLTALQGFAGTPSEPGFAFDGDTDTGLYRDSANVMSAATGGQARQSWSDTASTFTVPLKAAAGTMADPSITFSGDADSGFYLVSAGVVGIVAAGVAVGTFQSDRTRLGALTVNGDLLGTTAKMLGSGATAGLESDTSSTTGYAASLKGNATRAALHLEPQAVAPTTPTKGDVYCGTDGKFYGYNGAAWVVIGTQT